MFSTSQKSMLCVNCFRDTPADARLHCVDIDTAYTQDSKKLDRAVGVRINYFGLLTASECRSLLAISCMFYKCNAILGYMLHVLFVLQSIRELQGSVRDGLLLFKSLLDELRRNMDVEKLTINNFCQGMQEAIAKTHSSMIMEVQR